VLGWRSSGSVRCGARCWCSALRSVLARLLRLVEEVAIACDKWDSIRDNLKP
jgi:hypothetical protein